MYQSFIRHIHVLQWHFRFVFTECMQTAGNVPSSSIVSASSLPVNNERTRKVAMLTMVRINWNINVSPSQHQWRSKSTQLRQK